MTKISPYNVACRTVDAEPTVKTLEAYGRIVDSNRGIYLNPMRNLTVEEVNKLQKIADALGITTTRFNPMGFTEFDNHGQGIRSLTAFYDDPKYIGVVFLKVKNQWVCRRLHLQNYLELLEDHLEDFLNPL